MKGLFENPVMNVVKFEVADIITTSVPINDMNAADEHTQMAPDSIAPMG